MRHTTNHPVAEAKYWCTGRMLDLPLFLTLHPIHSLPSKDRQKSFRFLCVFATTPLAKVSIGFYLEFWNGLRSVFLPFSLALLQLNLCPRNRSGTQDINQIGSLLPLKLYKGFPQQLESIKVLLVLHKALQSRDCVSFCTHFSFAH